MMLVPLLMTVSMLSDVKQARHHIPPPDRRSRGRLGGQTRAVPRVLSPSSLSPSSLSRRMKTGPALLRPASPKLFVLILPPPTAPTLPHPLMALANPVKLTLQPPEEQQEEELAGAINHERTRLGLGPLMLDPLLCAAARAHSREMCDRHYFDHQSPTSGEQTPMDRYLTARREAGEGRPHQIAVGENIFYASRTDGEYNMEFAHQALMASPGHRLNILAPRFTKVGVGLCRDPNGRFWVTEMFLQDSPQDN